MDSGRRRPDVPASGPRAGRPGRDVGPRLGVAVGGLPQIPLEWEFVEVLALDLVARRDW
jgi:hypothetical protein